MINLKRLYNSVYSQSTSATHKRPTVVVMFDAKKAFDSVWHEGVIHKCFRDGLPKIIIRFLAGWLNNRTLRVRIGDVLSKEVPAESGVPQGSVLSPLIWNYWMGDCPTNLKPQCSTSLYADDTSVWATNTQVTTTVLDIQHEIWALTDWTATKRIKFEPKKTYLLGCHRDLSKRKEIKTHTIYLNRDKTEPLQWVPHAKLLGLTFSETGTFHHHLKIVSGKCMARLRNLWRFSGYVPGPTLMKVYRAAIEPILLYGLEVIFETLTPIVQKRLLAIEYAAIRIAYKLDRNATIAECLATHQGESIITRLERRRTNFVIKNADNPTIRHTESLKTNQGRHLRVRKNYVDKHSVRDWKRPLYTHRNMTFFSDIDSSNYRIIDPYDPETDIIRDNRLPGETILEHINRMQDPSARPEPSTTPESEPLFLSPSSTQPTQTWDPPKITLRRGDNGATIIPFDPLALNLKIRRSRRDAPSSGSDTSDTEEDTPYRRYPKSEYPAFDPVPYLLPPYNPQRYIKNTQTRIAAELNATRSRSLEWKRNQTQNTIAQNIISDIPSTDELTSLPNDHTYSQLPNKPATHSKMKLHSAWDYRPSRTPNSHNPHNSLPTACSTDLSHQTPGSPHYPWGDSDSDNAVSPNKQDRATHINHFPWADSDYFLDRTAHSPQPPTLKTGKRAPNFFGADEERIPTEHPNLPGATHKANLITDNAHNNPIPADYFPWDDSEGDNSLDQTTLLPPYNKTPEEPATTSNHSTTCPSTALSTNLPEPPPALPAPLPNLPPKGREPEKSGSHLRRPREPD